MSSLAIVNAGDRSDGVTQSIEPYFESLPRLGYSVRWYQCVDYHGHPHVPEGGVIVRGLGFPSRTVDMGVNRLWVFPHQLRGLREDTILLADPTLARIQPTGGRVAVYVHDIRPLTRYSDRFSTRMTFRDALPRLRRVWRIIVPSDFVRQSLVDMNFDPAMIRTVPETHRLGFHPDHLERSLRRVSDRHETRVLYVGTDRPYKNIDLVLELAKRFENRAEHRYQFTLVSRLRESTRRRVAELGLHGVHVLSDVDSMGRVYEENDVLLFPSLYEGFGRPLIEAMAYGLPILANRIPPAAEVVGGGGFLLDGGDMGAWAHALLSLEDPTVMEAYARRSLERGETYLPVRFEASLLSAIGAS